MEDRTAKDIIAMRDRARAEQNPLLYDWQDLADLCYPRQNRIGGTSLALQTTRTVQDNTGVQDSQRMASGMSSTLIPIGQEFFGFRIRDNRLRSDDKLARYVSEASAELHQQMFESNFMLQLNEALRDMLVFGTCNLFTEWDTGPNDSEKKRGRNGSYGQLNYKAYPTGTYQILEDDHGNVDTMLLSFQLSARQGVLKFGSTAVSDELRKANDKSETAEDVFEFIHCVRPRANRNQQFIDNLNMPYESVYVDVKGQVKVLETGYEEFPFAVARWTKGNGEKYGRGQGAEALPFLRMLQNMMKDYIDLCNKYADPPILVRQGFEGSPNLTPHGVNIVNDPMTDIRGLEQQVLGNAPVTEQAVEAQRQTIHESFYRDVFGQMGSLKGDRRTTTEILERAREGLRQLSMPVSRIESELLTPLITRSLNLLIRNGRIPPPPLEFLGGNGYGIEYLGELGLALRNQQVEGFIRWVSALGQIARICPEVIDLVNVDSGARRLARNRGVNIDDVATEEQVAAKREARQKQQAAAMAAQVAQMAAKGYSQTNKAPEAGSLAGELMGVTK